MEAIESSSSLSSSTSSLMTWSSEGEEEEKKGFSWDQTKPNPFCIPHVSKEKKIFSINVINVVEIDFFTRVIYMQITNRWFLYY
jgi:hypothetical protein